MVFVCLLHSTQKSTQIGLSLKKVLLSNAPILQTLIRIDQQDSIIGYSQSAPSLNLNSTDVSDGFIVYDNITMLSVF